MLCASEPPSNLQLPDRQLDCLQDLPPRAPAEPAAWPWSPNTPPPAQATAAASFHGGLLHATGAHYTELDLWGSTAQV